jgi:spheroidene monooxygenase
METDMQTGTVAVVVLINTRTALSGVWRLVTGRWRTRAIQGATFVKVLGSGRGGGFVPVPSPTHLGLFVSFTDDAAADVFLSSRLLDGYRAVAAELLTMKLRAFSSKGEWSGRVPLSTTAREPEVGPIASLTRASIRPAKAVSFWVHAAPSQVSLESAKGCLVSAGLGEAPFFRQATLTVWENMSAMHAFARNGAHLEAIKRARTEHHFSEDLFARFVPTEINGSWQGRRFGNGESALVEPV